MQLLFFPWLLLRRRELDVRLETLKRPSPLRITPFSTSVSQPSTPLSPQYPWCTTIEEAYERITLKPLPADSDQFKLLCRWSGEADSLSDQIHRYQCQSSSNLIPPSVSVLTKLFNTLAQGTCELGGRQMDMQTSDVLNRADEIVGESGCAQICISAVAKKSGQIQPLSTTDCEGEAVKNCVRANSQDSSVSPTPSDGDRMEMLLSSDSEWSIQSLCSESPQSPISVTSDVRVLCEDCVRSIYSVILKTQEIGGEYILNVCVCVCVCACVCVFRWGQRSSSRFYLLNMRDPQWQTCIFYLGLGCKQTIWIIAIWRLE